jgi:hypothetical protein
MRTTARVAAALLSTTIVVGGTATTAFAQSTTVKDKASDVLSFTGPADERGTQLSYSESNASGVDLRSLRVKHTKKSVAVSLTFSNLDYATTAIVSLRVDGKSEPSRFLLNSDDKTGTVLNTQGKKRCTVPVTHRYGNRGSIHAVIKRSCLGTPDRVKATAFAAEQGYFADNTAFKADSVSPNGVRSSTWTKWLKAS